MGRSNRWMLARATAEANMRLPPVVVSPQAGATGVAGTFTVATAKQELTADESGGFRHLSYLHAATHVQIRRATDRVVVYDSGEAAVAANLLQHSQGFDVSAWDKGTLVSVQGNVATSPVGDLTADKLVATAIDARHFIHQMDIPVQPGAEYTWASYLQSGEYTWAALDLFDSANRKTWFNLATGEVGTIAPDTAASIVPAGSGWYRCAITRVVDTATVNAAIILAVQDGEPDGFLGDGASGIYAWGAQLMVGNALGYVATDTTQRYHAWPVSLAPATGYEIRARHKHDDGYGGYWLPWSEWQTFTTA